MSGNKWWSAKVGEKLYITLLGIEIFFIKQCPLKFMSGNKWWSAKVGEKLFSDLVIFSILSSGIPLDFYDSTRVVPLNCLMYLQLV